ncbi:dipeptidase [Desulfogranum mediterraneum]|uniref:dipeptidase n=1 Tax=Desulfogranum mediterraneum TaxID=160661 RepID=UPI000418AB94|nr:membrane dipeptidase [Desulfogranum mediterraneum]
MAADSTTGLPLKPSSGLAGLIDARVNRTLLAPRPLSAEAARLHGELRVVDLHADFLLWNRGAWEFSSRGHLDRQRLHQGNVAIQVCAAVTGVPATALLGARRHPDRWDTIDLLGRLQGWPRQTRSSRLARALYQAEKLKAIIAAAGDSPIPLKLITSCRDIDEVLDCRSQGEALIGVILALEGAHALEGNPANIQPLFQAGYRILGLTHFMDNAMAGAAEGKTGHGLTPAGQTLVQQAQELGMLLDLAHASEETIEDLLGMTSRPVMASHGGVRATSDSPRNLGPAQVAAIGRTEGVVGIGLFARALGGQSLTLVSRAMDYVATRAGLEHVALGSDFDGFVSTVVDSAGLPRITQALLRHLEGREAEPSFASKKAIAGIMGENVLRVLRQTLPGE